MTEPEFFQMMLNGQERIAAGMIRLEEKIDGTNNKVEDMRVQIAGFAIEPRFKSLENFRRAWEPKLIVGLFVSGIAGAAVALLIKKILG